MDAIKEENREILSTAGLRNTSQRAIILDIIRQGEGHLDADEVFRRARSKQPRISLSTVYRTLQKLKQMGLIEELHFDETHHHYEIKPSTEHHHLVCEGCGRIIEFNYPLLRMIAKKVPEAKDFEITGAEVKITGYCSECRRRRE
jgi:Fur family ferric uptake transcriptional regulator